MFAECSLDDEHHKSAFYAENATTYDKNLSRSMEHHVEEVKKSSEVLAFTGNGKLMDEEDLAEKYKSKPKQLEAMLRKARTLYDKSRVVTFYEDSELTSTGTRTDEKIRTHKRLGGGATY